MKCCDEEGTNNDDLQMLKHSSPVRCISVALPTPIQLVNVLRILHILLARHLLLWLMLKLHRGG
jgi:hypothetical protein